jgi:hypothetical protein
MPSLFFLPTTTTSSPTPTTSLFLFLLVLVLLVLLPPTPTTSQTTTTTIQFSTWISKPFHLNMPDMPPNGPVHGAVLFGVPGSSKLMISTKIGHMQAIGSWENIPRPNDFQLEGIARNFVPTWDAGFNQPPIGMSSLKCTMSPNRRYVLCGAMISSTQHIYVFESAIWPSDFAAQNNVPMFTYKGEVSASTVSQITGVVGNEIILSDITDIDGDGSSNDCLIGGSNGGSLVRVKISWNSDTDWTPTFSFISTDSFLTNPGPGSEYLTNRHYLKATVYSPPQSSTVFVAFGDREGKLTIHSVGRNNNIYTWNFVQSLTFTESMFPQWPTTGSPGLPTNNYYLSPQFIYIDKDTIPDGIGISFNDGSFAYLYRGLSTAGGALQACNPVCTNGHQFGLGCTCEPCAAGTYKSKSTDQWCTECGSPNFYCPEGGGRFERAVGKCTSWLPYPSTKNFVYLSPDYVRDITYYSSNYGRDGGARFIEATTGITNPINSKWTLSSLSSNMFGGMMAWRNTERACGSIAITNGEFQKWTNVIRDSIAAYTFSLENPGGLPVNASFSFPQSGIQAQILAFDLGLTSVTKYTVYPPSYGFGSTVKFQVKIDVNTIPNVDILSAFNLTVRITPSQYWRQNDSISVSQDETPIDFIIELGLIDRTVLSDPSSITDVVLETNQIAVRSIRIYNLLETNQSLSFDTQYLTSCSIRNNIPCQWVSIQLQSDSVYGTSSKVGSIAVCRNETAGMCDVVDQNTKSFQRVMIVTFNTSEMTSGTYFASVRVVGVDIPLQLKVFGGPVLWSKSTWEFVDESGLPFSPTVDPGYTVQKWPALRVVARDQYSSPTENFGGGGLTGSQVVLHANWAFDNGTMGCPGEISNNMTCPLLGLVGATTTTTNVPSCEGFTVMTKTLQEGVFTTSFAVPTNGTYKFWITVENPPHSGLFVKIGTENTVDQTNTNPNPRCVMVSARTCSDINSVPTKTGEACMCKSGYGKTSSLAISGDISCELCKPGTFSSIGGGESCQKCPSGYVSKEVGATKCIRCDHFLEEPNSDQSGCVACSGDDFVTFTGNTNPGSSSNSNNNNIPPPWVCKGCGTNERRRIVRGPPNNTVIMIPHPEPPNPFNRTLIQSFACACLPNMYYDVKTALCKLCPDGGFCVDKMDSTVLPRQGFWGPIRKHNTVPPTRAPTSVTPNPTLANNNNNNGGGSIAPTLAFIPGQSLGPTIAGQTRGPTFNGPPPNGGSPGPTVPGPPPAPPGRRQRELQQIQNTQAPGSTLQPTVPNNNNNNGSTLTPTNTNIPIPGQELSDTIEFIKCRRTSACPGVDISDSQLSIDDAVFQALQDSPYPSNSTVCTECEEGFTGPLCFKCSSGFNRAGTNQCIKCLDQSAVIGLLALGGFFAIVVCIYIIRRTIAASLIVDNMASVASSSNSTTPATVGLVTEDTTTPNTSSTKKINATSSSAAENQGEEQNQENREVIVLRIAMSHLQSQAMCQGVELGWPGFVADFFNVYDLLSSCGYSVFSLDCVMNTAGSSSHNSATTSTGCSVFDDGRLRTFFISSIFIALLPAFGAITSGTFWSGAYIYSKHFGEHKRHGRKYWQYFLVSMCIILFLLYPSLSRTALKFFSCSREEILGNRFLEADFNVICWSDEHLSWALTLGLLMLLGYSLGIPVFVYFLLRARVQGTSEYAKRYSKTFAFLYAGFKPEFWYWEVVTLVRKFGIALCSSLLKPFGSDIQAFSACIVVVIALLAQVHCRPYDDNQIQFIETFGLTTLYLTLFLGLFQSSASLELGESSPVHTIFGIIIVLLNVVFLCYIVYIIFHHSIRGIKEHGVVNLLSEAVMGHSSRRGLNGGIGTTSSSSPSPKHHHNQHGTGKKIDTSVMTGAKPTMEQVYNIEDEESKRISMGA